MDEIGVHTLHVARNFEKHDRPWIKTLEDSFMTHPRFKVGWLTF